MDDRICVLLNLAVYLEFYTTSIESEPAMFFYGNGRDGIRAVWEYLTDIFGISFTSTLLLYYVLPVCILPIN